MAIESKKLVVVGDGGSGKTCLLIVFSQGVFPERYVPTVFENYITTVQHPLARERQLELALWDTAGQEEYDRLRPLSYPESSVLLVCFAIDSHASLDNVLDKWYPEVRHFCPNTPIVLVGLKSDLRRNERAINILKTQGQAPISFQEAFAVAQKMGAEYVECSARENRGVHEVFKIAIELSCGEEERKAYAHTNGNSSKKNEFIRRKPRKRHCVVL